MIESLHNQELIALAKSWKSNISKSDSMGHQRCYRNCIVNVDKDISVIEIVEQLQAIDDKYAVRFKRMAELYRSKFLK